MLKAHSRLSLGVLHRWIFILKYIFSSLFIYFWWPTIYRHIRRDWRNRQPCSTLKKQRFSVESSFLSCFFLIHILESAFIDGLNAFLYSSPVLYLVTNLSHWPAGINFTSCIDYCVLMRFAILPECWELLQKKICSLWDRLEHKQIGASL